MKIMENKIAKQAKQIKELKRRLSAKPPLLVENPYTDTKEEVGERGYITSSHRAYEKGKKAQRNSDIEWLKRIKP